MATVTATVSGRRLWVGMLALFVCDAFGGFLAVVSGLATWGEAWGFETEYTVPVPFAAVQLALAWLAARNVRPPVGLIAAVVLVVLCLISLLFGLFDGDLTDEVASAGYPGGIVWGIVLVAVTAVVGVLAVARARGLYRLR